jgi:hypothetical protein
MLACPKCGYSNELGRIFCHQCGNKLDLSQIKPPGQGGPKIKKKRGSGLLKTVRTLLELALLLAVIAVFFLAWQVPTPPSGKPSDAVTMSVENKRMQLEMLVRRTRPGKLVVTSQELDAFFASLQMEKPPAEWLSFTPEHIRCELGEGNVRVRLWGNLRLGDVANKQFYLSYTVIPDLDGGELLFTPVTGRIGQLTLPVTVINRLPVLQHYMGEVFRGLQRDRDNLRKLTSITVTSESVTLEREAPPAAPKP